MPAYPAPPQTDRGFRTALALALALAFLGACAERAAQETSANAAAPVRVRLAEVAPAAGPASIGRSATVRARTDVTFAGESAGVVIARPAPEGSRVERGDPLFLLDAQAERANFHAAEARLATLAATDADLATRRQAEAAVAIARQALERRTVRAPVAGVVESYTLEAGEFLAPGAPLGRIVDPARLYAKALLLEEEILRIRPGDRVRIAFGVRGGRELDARTTRIAGAESPGTGRFEVEFDLLDPEGILPGFVGTVRIPLAEERPALIVPREAVFLRHGTERVLLAIDEADALVARETEIRTRERPGRADLAEVLEGLAAGDRVITRGRLGLPDGAPILVEE